MLSGPTPSGHTPAPYHHEVAEGPDGVEAWWVTAEDGTRLRLGVWPRGAKGTVLLFPGRTEYIEKYGRVATDMANAGYGMVAFDWRGQGLADRPAHRRDMGHVISFDEYRQDVAAFRKVLEQLDLPKPWYMVGHSMGGCIGLRALHDGLSVSAAAFTGPMWGLQLTPLLKPISPLVLALAGPLGFGKTFAPTTGPFGPMAFENNILTTDRDQFDYMERQTEVHPDLGLGGPSLTWVKVALEECRTLLDMPAPNVPAIGIVGTDERRVSIEAVHQRMADWPGGDVLEIEGGRHELLLESPDKRTATIDAILRLFAAH